MFDACTPAGSFCEKECVGRMTLTCSTKTSVASVPHSRHPVHPGLLLTDRWQSVAVVGNVLFGCVESIGLLHGRNRH